jgi:hypothetical protein
MFGNLKTRNERKSVFKDRPHPKAFSQSPGASSSVTKGNETRLIRCRHCGWICDKERDVNLRDGSYAGFGINQGAQLTAGSSIGDRKTPVAGSVSGTADQYYDRTVSAGCPCCGSYVYDPRQKIIPWPQA